MSSPKAILRSFCMSSSIKGLPKLLKADTKFIRLLWLSGVMVGLVVGIFQTVAFLRVFFNYNINTNIALHDTARKTFPDVTVCKVNPSTIVGEEGNWTYENYQEMVDGVINNENGEDRALLLSIGGLFGFYRNIDIGNHSVKGSLKYFLVYCKIMKSTVSIDCDQPGYVFLTPGFPMCMTFKQDADKHIMSTWSAVFYLEDFEPEPDSQFFRHPTAQYHSGLKVFLHSPGSYPNLQQPYTAGPGQETFLDVSETFYKYLPLPYSGCYQGRYVEESDLVYTYHNCRYMCRQRELMDRCGCLDPDMPIPYVVDKAKYCGYLYVNHPEQTANQIRCWEAAVVDLSRMCNKQCPVSCDSSTFESLLFPIQWPHVSRHLAFYDRFIKGNPTIYSDHFQLYSNITKTMAIDRKMAYQMLRETDLLERNFLKLTVYLGSDRLFTYEAVPHMTVSAMTGSLGGILNMWIGLTFFTAIELVELLIQLVRLRSAPEVIKSDQVIKSDVPRKEEQEKSTPDIDSVEQL